MAWIVETCMCGSSFEVRSLVAGARVASWRKYHVCPYRPTPGTWTTIRTLPVEEGNDGAR